MRDYKRRRQSYRAKNVHITKKSYTEVGSLRESWEFSLCLVHISINNSIPVQTRKNLLCLLCPSWLEFANLLIRESLWFSLLQEVTGNRSISGSSEFFMWKWQQDALYSVVKWHYYFYAEILFFKKYTVTHCFVVVCFLMPFFTLRWFGMWLVYIWRNSATTGRKRTGWITQRCVKEESQNLQEGTSQLTFKHSWGICYFYVDSSSLRAWNGFFGWLVFLRGCGLIGWLLSYTVRRSFYYRTDSEKLVTVKLFSLNKISNVFGFCSPRKEDRRSASVDSRQSAGSSKDTERTRHRRDSSRSPSKRKRSRERGKDRDSRRKRERWDEIASAASLLLNQATVQKKSLIQGKEHLI